MLYKIHQILVITVILMFVSVHSKHCTLDAMRNWAEEACENLRGIEFRERRHISESITSLPPHVKVRRDSFPHAGYLMTTQSAANSLHELDLNPKYHVLSTSHMHRFLRYKRNDEESRITHYCCQRQCGIFTGC